MRFKSEKKRKRAALVLGVLFFLGLQPAWACDGGVLTGKVRGMLLGSALGDALGGPLEFRPAERSRATLSRRKLKPPTLAQLAAALRLRPYPGSAAPYAQWIDFAPPGTTTDDTRHKALFMRSFSLAGRPDSAALARVYAEFAENAGQGRVELAREWLREYSAAARWKLGLGERDGGLPPDRLWGGHPTSAGQMIFTPIAALYPGDPRGAYLAAWDTNIFETGVARDFSSAMVAGLAEALRPGASWESVEQAVLDTDPYGFGRVPWVPRSVAEWLRTAADLATRSRGVTPRFFSELRSALRSRVGWEAWVQPTQVFATARFVGLLEARREEVGEARSAATAGTRGLAALQLVLEFGGDTDSAAQLLGAFLGALGGGEVFPKRLAIQVEERLRLDEGVELDQWVGQLCRSISKGGSIRGPEGELR